MSGAPDGGPPQGASGNDGLLEARARPGSVAETPEALHYGGVVHASELQGAGVKDLEVQVPDEANGALLGEKGTGSSEGGYLWALLREHQDKARNKT